MSVLKKIKKPLILIMLGVAVVAYYLYLSNRNNDNTDKMTNNSVVAEYIDRDMEKNYPGTPRAVVLWYSKMIKAVYEKDLTDEDVKGMAKNLYAMFDDELKEKNPYDQYVASVAAEINAYNDANKIISDFVVEDDVNIEFITYEGNKYAKVDVLYYVHEDTKIIKVYHEYTLRKDSKGDWRILFWEITDSNKMEGR